MDNEYWHKIHAMNPQPIRYGNEFKNRIMSNEKEEPKLCVETLKWVIRNMPKFRSINNFHIGRKQAAIYELALADIENGIMAEMLGLAKQSESD